MSEIGQFVQAGTYERWRAVVPEGKVVHVDSPTGEQSLKIALKPTHIPQIKALQLSIIRELRPSGQVNTVTLEVDPNNRILRYDEEVVGALKSNGQRKKKHKIPPPQVDLVLGQVSEHMDDPNSVTTYGDAVTEMPTRSQELRERLSRRFSRYRTHWRIIEKGQPDYDRDPEGFMRFEDSMEVLMEHGAAVEIARRLAVPVWERLQKMVDQDRATGYVESPTNAKQTVKAIRQIDQRIEDDFEMAKHFYPDPRYQAIEDDIYGSGREVGDVVYNVNGNKIIVTQADVEKAAEEKRKREEERQKPDEWVLRRHEELRQRRAHYESLLPEHYKARVKEPKG